MNGSSISYQRMMVGIIALVCLGTSAAMWCFMANPGDSGLVAALGRVGFVMAALWLALPRKGESIAWEKAIPVLVVAAVVVALARRAFIWIVPAALVVGLAAVFLRPKPKGKRSR